MAKQKSGNLEAYTEERVPDPPSRLGAPRAIERRAGEHVLTNPPFSLHEEVKIAEKSALDAWMQPWRFSLSPDGYATLKATTFLFRLGGESHYLMTDCRTSQSIGGLDCDER